MTLEQFLSHLERVKRNGNGYTASCPAHDDSRNSLSVSQNGNKILLKCFAGCQTEGICESINLDLKDLFYDSQPNGHKTHKTQNKPKIIKTEEICAYDYRDEMGELLYQNVRFLITFEGGTTDKDFRARRIENGREIWNLDDVQRVPYRLPELIAALEQNPKRIVILTEGEKDADNLRSLGLIASSFKNWKPEFNFFITGANVVLLIDHDKSGIKQATDAAQIIHGEVTSLRVVDLYANEPLPEKHGRDVSDWLETHFKDELQEIIKNTFLWNPSDEKNEDFEETKIKPFPQPDEKCFHGLAGEFVRLIEPHTEADKTALLIQFLTYFGNIIGRSAFYQVEADKHFTNLFGVLVGDTASGRKGTSTGRVKEIFKGEDEAHEKDCIVSGLASGEGLLWHIRDEIWEEKTDKKSKKIERICTDSGVSDKRLLIIEGEFAQVLRVQGREGNTLSAFLRNLWDSGTARNLTKNSPLRTTDAHVSIIGHITRTELLNCLDEVESANGYANRFLWFAVRRSKFLPFGAGEIDFDEYANFQRNLSERIKFARGVERMNFTPEARNLYASVYQRLETSRYGFLAKITQRAAAYVCRLSCIFALLDGKAEIDYEHLEAALAVWQYAEDSARYIFGERSGDKNADAILNALSEAENGLTRSEIRNLFDRHINKEKLDSALQFLLESGLARYEKVGTKGRAIEIWFACVLSVKSNKSFENEANENLLTLKTHKTQAQQK